MKPGFEFRQVIALFVILFQGPILTARAVLRLSGRGLNYLADNPDLVWTRYLLANAGPAMLSDALILIMNRGKPVFSLLVGKNLSGNLPDSELRSVRDLDSFREKMERDMKRPLQVVQLDAVILERIKTSVVNDKGLDAFFIVGREILSALAEGRIRFSPIIQEAAIGASLEGDELLCKFGPRFGLSHKSPVRLSRVMRGLGLVLAVPITRRRRRRILIAFRDQV
jgi:hypothetical protein